MKNSVLLFGLGAFMASLGSFASAYAKPEDPNPMEIVVGGGPFAGSYKSNPAETICLRSGGDKYIASYKDFATHDTKAMNEAGLVISNPEDPTRKSGEVRISFGDPDNHPVVYDLNLTADDARPLTVTKTTASTTLAFHGSTKEGIPISITVNCQDISDS